jgi:hypothetical protein
LARQPLAVESTGMESVTFGGSKAAARMLGAPGSG